MTPLQTYAQRVATQPDNELFRFSYGKALIEDSQWEEAERHFLVAFEKRPDWMAVAILLGQCARQRGDRVLAKQRYEEALRLALLQDHQDPASEIQAALANL